MRDFRPVGLLAQLVEQLTLNQRVTGSSPVQPTNFLFMSPSAWKSDIV